MNVTQPHQHVKTTMVDIYADVKKAFTRLGPINVQVGLPPVHAEYILIECKVSIPVTQSAFKFHAV